MPQRSAVRGLGVDVPARVVTNRDLEARLETSDAWIRSRTGISERRVLERGQATSDMAARAAIRALRDAGRSPADCDLIVVATNTPDMPFPSTAALVGAKIGAERCAAFDLEAGCAGFVYAMRVADGLVRAGTCRTVLVIGAEALSRVVDWDDRNTAVLFGDAAGAVVLEAATEQDPGGVLGGFWAADGRGGDLLKLPAGGARRPASVESVRERGHFLKMSGREVFRFAVEALPQAADAAVKDAGLTWDAVDLLVPHQANDRITHAARERLGLEEARVVSCVARYGNTSTASIGLALAEARRQRRLRLGQVQVWAAFGAGLSWGAVAVRWSLDEAKRAAQRGHEARVSWSSAAG
jgi:3-oxoacyl-[acyl-carrier-protein] synthase-3